MFAHHLHNLLTHSYTDEFVQQSMMQFNPYDDDEDSLLNAMFDLSVLVLSDDEDDLTLNIQL